MKKHRIDVLVGTARLEKGSPAPKVIVEKGKGEGIYTAKKVKLATGARARVRSLCRAVGLPRYGRGRARTRAQILCPKAGRTT